MSTPIPEQLVTAQKASMESAFGLANKALGSIEKLAELNWKAFQSALAENEEFVTRAVSAKNPQELWTLQAGVAQPAADKALSYVRQATEIVSTAQAEFSAALSTQAQQYQREAQAFIENVGKNMPPGTEAVAAAWKSALSSASEPKTAKKSSQAEAAGK